MTHPALEERARLVRPKIRKLARQGRAMDAAFKVTRAVLYPGATPDQIAAMRAMFFAGAAELLAYQLYGLSEGPGQTEADDDLMARLAREVEERHNGMIELALARHGDGGHA